LLGIGSHLALDALNSYGVRPFLPFDPRWYYGDAVLIVDPWLWLALGGAAALGARRAPVSDVLWLAAVAAGAGLMAWSGRVPVAVIGAWAAAMAAILAARLGWLPRPPQRLAAATGVACALGYIGVAFAAAAAARARAVAAVETLLPADAQLDATSVTPLPALPWRHECLVKKDGLVHRVRVDLLSGEVDLSAPLAQNLDDPVLERVRMTQRLRAWRVFARVPYVSRPARGSGEVIVGDLRYGHEPAAREWSSQRLPVD
jgi:inner membrane protein